MNTTKRGGYVPDWVDVPGKTATFLETNSVEGVHHQVYQIDWLFLHCSVLAITSWRKSILHVYHQVIQRLIE